MAIGYGVACPKPEPRKRVKAREKRAESKQVKAIRAAVFERDRFLCRCCGHRPAESMHEIRPRSLGGKVSMENSIASCGSGTTGCHGRLQSHRIMAEGKDANKPLTFVPATNEAREWMNGSGRE
jgi:5-methylcytosine-specific restriction endonuclease McrA